MSLRLAVVVVLGSLVLGCAKADPVLLVTVDKHAIDGRTQRAVVHIEATDEDGKPGRGVARLTAAAGAFIEGDAVPLVEGITSATFTCDPADDAACNGDVRLGIDWGSSSGALVVRVGSIAAVTPVYWRVVPTGTTADLVDAAVASDGSIWAVGSSGTVLRFADGAWAPVASPVASELTGVSGGPGNQVTVVGAGGVVLRWNGAALEAIDVGVDDDFSAVWGAGQIAFITSRSGKIYAFDGTALEVRFEASAALRSISGRGADVWAAGDGVVATLTGGVWTEQASAVLGNWNTVLIDPDGVWIGGERTDVASHRGLVMLGPTPEWRSAQVGGDGITDLFWPDSSEERFAATLSEVYRKVGDEPWTALRAPAGGRAIAGRSSADIVVVGAHGIALQRVP